MPRVNRAPPGKKICTRCGRTKLLDQFARNRANLEDGRRGDCKDCSNAIAREYIQKPEVKEYRAAYGKTYLRYEPERRIYKSAKLRAAKNGVPFTIQVTDIKVPERCPVLGTVLRRDGRGPHDEWPSIDRVDGRKGYVPGNVHVISVRANRIKNDATLAELLAVVEYIRKHSE